MILGLPSQHLLVQSRQWKHQNNVRNLFKVNNNVSDIVPGSLLLILEKLHTMFSCFHCWIWASKCRVEYLPAGFNYIRYFFSIYNLCLSLTILISHNVLVFLLLTVNMFLLTKCKSKIPKLSNLAIIWTVS